MSNSCAKTDLDLVNIGLNDIDKNISCNQHGVITCPPDDNSGVPFDNINCKLNVEKVMPTVGLSEWVV